MSPNESDLRAALRDGEGDDRPDVDGLIAHVRGRRAQRRVRLLSGAAAVVVVAAAAVGGAVVWGGSDGHQPKANSPAGYLPATPAPTGTPSGKSIARTGPSHAATRSPAAVSITCASSAPQPVDTPASPGARMFTAPVQTLVVCSYTDGSIANQVTLSGSAAQTLATSIEAASPSREPIMCPDIATGKTTVLALLPVTADGTVLPTVTTDVSIPDCNRPISNGSAVRYNWRPPASLTAQLAAPR